ncbi:MAG: butyrate kinase, partial [Oscillospiraceae bacterium]
ISKAIGSVSAAIRGNVEAVILTGGMAHSKILTDKIKEYVSFIAPVEVFPGENELSALALGGFRILKGEETAREF